MPGEPGKLAGQIKNLTDKGKPVERQGRKAKGSKAHKSHDSLATETGFLYVSTLSVPQKEGLF